MNTPGVKDVQMNCIVTQAVFKRGAGDPINALLNFGYTIVTRELEGLIEGAGLDPAVGFYHHPDNDRPSLACDWVEEFRHPLVDRVK